MSYIPQNSSSRSPHRQRGRKRMNVLDFSENTNQIQLDSIPNILLDSQKVYENNNEKINQNLKYKQQIKSSRKIKSTMKLVDDQDIPQGQIKKQNNKISFNFINQIRLLLGQSTIRGNYPQNKLIFLNNNNQKQNQQNLNLTSQKQQQYNATVPESNYQNTLITSKSLAIFSVLWRQVLCQLYFIIYLLVTLGIIIMQMVLFKGYIQYGPQWIFNIILWLFSIIINIIICWLNIRNRRSFTQPNQKYRVYYHDGSQAEWKPIEQKELKHGYLYKINPGQRVPCDSIILYSPRSFITIQQRQLYGKLIQQYSEITLKQSLIKVDTIILPISGYLNYTIQYAEINNSTIIGKLHLLEPVQIIHSFNMNNIILKNSYNYSQQQLLCLCLENGINSLFVKNIQYPFQYRSYGQQYNSSYLRCQLNVILDRIILLLLILYLIIIIISFLVGFMYNLLLNLPFYIGSNQQTIFQILLHHIFNYVIIIPILIKTIFNCYLFIAAKITMKNIQNRMKQNIQLQNHNPNIQNTFQPEFKIKDYNDLPEISTIDTIITTIDTFRNSNAHQLQAIRVKDLDHNFNNIGGEIQKIYQTKDLELIEEFMSVALLSTFRDNQYLKQSKYQESICNQCNKLDMKLEVKNQGKDLEITKTNIKLNYMFGIEATQKYPWKLLFFRTPQQMNHDSRILCVGKGHPQLLLNRIYDKQVLMAQKARKLHQQKGYHVEILVKATLNRKDVEQFKNSFIGITAKQNEIYRGLDKFMKRMQPMGLLIYGNQFNQFLNNNKNYKNPILYKGRIQNQYLNNKSQSIITTDQVPEIIIISPPSQAIDNPQFQSIHTITSLLIHPTTFFYSLKQVSTKIMHQPVGAQKLIDLLREQKVVVWNGWDQKSIIDTIRNMKVQGRKIAVYLERDQYTYLTKQCNLSIKGGSSLERAIDLKKYSDIEINTNITQSLMSIIPLIRYDSILIRNNLQNLILIQLNKSVIFSTLQFINMFYSLGSGLSFLQPSIYFLIEIILFLDILYFINWNDSCRSNLSKNYYNFTYRCISQFIQTLILIILIFFLTIYSLQTPPQISGNIHNFQFTQVIFGFIIAHILILQKIFNNHSLSISLYKISILLIQLCLFYAGLIVISSLDIYRMKNILYFMLRGNFGLTALYCIWLGLSFSWCRLIYQLINQYNSNSIQNKHQLLSQSKMKKNDSEFMD